MAAMHWVVLGAALCAALAQPMVPCSWSVPNFSASFDLSALYAYPAQGGYIWADPFDYDTTNSTYIFNVCANVILPQQWAPICLGNSPAFQITSNGGGPACYPLGVDLSVRGSSVSWGLLDSTDPSAGVTLTYVSGIADESCPTTNKFRSFMLDFGCAKSKFPPPGQAPTSAALAFIDEKDTCIYRAHSWSTAGCPQQCPVVGGALCGGNGVCGFDKGKNAPRCFCYDDWTEADCQTPSSPYPSSAVAGAVIGGLLFGGLATVGSAWAYAWLTRMKRAAADAPVDGFYEPVKA